MGLIGAAVLWSLDIKWKGWCMHRAWALVCAVSLQPFFASWLAELWQVHLCGSFLHRGHEQPCECLSWLPEKALLGPWFLEPRSKAILDCVPPFGWNNRQSGRTVRCPLRLWGSVVFCSQSLIGPISRNSSIVKQCLWPFLIKCGVCFMKGERESLLLFTCWNNNPWINYVVFVRSWWISLGLGKILNRKKKVSAEF